MKEALQFCFGLELSKIMPSIMATSLAHWPKESTLLGPIIGAHWAEVRRQSSLLRLSKVKALMRETNQHTSRARIEDPYGSEVIVYKIA